jgi:hypothetical protein
MRSDPDHVLKAGPLRVRFFWQKVRYAHQVLLERDASWVEVLGSVEGSPRDAWPASPPLQSLHPEVRSGGEQLALLVGMAGKSHWSSSVQLAPSGRHVQFDIACRVPAGQIGPLGSQYRILPSATPVDHQRIALVGASSAGEAMTFQFDTQTDAEPDGTRLVAADGLLTLEARGRCPAQKAHTIRWRYALELADAQVR